MPEPDAPARIEAKADRLGDAEDDAALPFTQQGMADKSEEFKKLGEIYVASRN